jgi:hypothetical protein
MATDNTALCARSAINEDARASIREALAIGLYCFGEISRVQAALAERRRLGKSELPEELQPSCPTGSVVAGTLSFGNALLWLDGGSI